MSEDTSIISTVLSIVIGVIVISLIAIPIISEVTAEDTIEYDNTTPWKSVVKDNAEMDISLIKNETTWTINGISTLQNAAIIYTDTVYIILNQNDGCSASGIDIDNHFEQVSTTKWGTTSATVENIGVTVTNNTLTISDLDDVQDDLVFNYNYIVYTDPDGEYSTFLRPSATKIVYIENESQIISIGWNNSASTVYSARGTTIGALATGVHIDPVAIEGADTVYSIDVGTSSIEYTLQVGQYVVHPMLVTVNGKCIEVIEDDSITRTIILTIPVFLVLGLLIAIASMFVSNNRWE